MKRILCSVVLFLATLSLSAQTVSLDKAINTLKERISLSGYAQTGYTYDDNNDKSNSFDVKRIIFMARGHITDNWSCYFMYNFKSGGKLLEVYMEYKLFPHLTIRTGQFKTMFSLENPLSTTVEELISCNSQAVAYLAGTNGSDPLYGSNAGRDMGLLIYGDLFNKYLHYDFAVMNGQGINVSDKNNRKDLVGRIIVNPLHWLSISGSFINGKGCAIALSDANPGLKIGDDYTRNRWATGATLKTKPFDLRTEYLEGKDGHVKSAGYYATACAHILPKFDFIASYDYFNKNKAMDYKQTNYVAGLQYWFYPRCRIQAQYTHCNRHIGEDNNLIQTQIQVRF